jgi:hypothetical protein
MDRAQPAFRQLVYFSFSKSLHSHKRPRSASLFVTSTERGQEGHKAILADSTTTLNKFFDHDITRSITASSPQGNVHSLMPVSSFVYFDYVEIQLPKWNGKLCHPALIASRHHNCLTSPQLPSPNEQEDLLIGSRHKVVR